MTVIDKIREHEDEFRDLPAIFDGEWRCTFAEMWDRVDRLSQGLIRLGVSKGDVVLAWLPNCHEAVESELACLQSGGIWVTLHAQMTWPEVRSVIRDTSPKVIIVSQEQYERLNPGDPKTPPCFEDTLRLIVGEVNSILSYEGLIATSPALRPEVDSVETDVARLRYTSGTTGKTKAAVLSHRAYLASLENHQNVLHDMDTTDRVLHAAPLTHASGSYMFPVMAAGGANVILRKFDAEEVLATIELEKITTLFVVPTMLQRMAASPGFAARDLSSLRTLAYGGAPTAVEKLAPIVERLGAVLIQIYGLTEALHPVTTLGREEHRAGNPNLDSIGKPTKINEVKIVDDRGVVISDKRVGEIFVRGANAMDGYWNDPEETSKVLIDGWIATGDLGYRDKNEYYRIVDRKKDVIISGGFNVYSAEVEAALSEHPGVAEVAVFGVPHDDWGEAVHAAVHLREGAEHSEAELIEHCRVTLAPYKSPKGISLHADSLPRNSAGKILKRDLREALWKGENRRIH